MDNSQGQGNTSDDAIHLLRRNRDQLKGKVTRFNTFVVNLQNDKSKLEQLLIRRQNIEDCYKEFDIIQTQLARLDVDEENSNERESFDDLYFGTMSNANKLLKSTNNLNQEQQNSAINQTYAQIKLPPIKIHTFDGATEQWLPFFNSFNSLIHSNPNLDNYQKLHYLKSSLTGPALDAIDALELTPNNYTVAYEYLQRRFKSTRLIVDNHVKGIVDLPVITKELPNAVRVLLDGYLKHLSALKMLNVTTDNWDPLLIHILVRKFDYNTRKEWENKLDNDKLPTLNQLTEFLTNRCCILEALKPDKSKLENNKSFKQQPKQVHVTTNSKYSKHCSFCKKDHLIYYCEDFLKLSANKRYEEIKKLNLCMNCLRSNHKAADCKSSTCKKCHQRHNSLLHIDSSPNNQTPNVTIANHVLNSQTILSTIIVNILDERDNTRHQCRALLDPGSQSNFITENMCNKLNLKVEPITAPVVGIGNSTLNITHSAKFTIYSRYNAFKVTLKCLILPKITGRVPIRTTDISSARIPQNIFLADPKFNISKDIDMLIGAELFWKILHMQQIKSTNSPLLQKTSFGWIVAGQINKELAHRTMCNLSINNKLEDQIQKFWNIEELQEAHQISSEEQRVEEHFLKTHYRTDEGRFVVRLPFNQSLTALGTSREMALKRLYFMERNFRRDEDLRQRYTNFMSEYIQLGHMVLTTEAEDQPNEQYYLPHFCVIKESSLSTKLRVVFDASSKTSTGISLNDKLLKGPTVQQSLISIVTRFRTHKYALTADIKKMYRQVLVHPEDQELQKVLWRSNDSEHVQTYKLQTVTYGTASAPYLATRCLNQVAIDHKEEFPDESLIVQADFYVDDLLTGANTVEDTMRLRSNITNLLKRGGFELSKWASNDRNILADLNAGEDNIIQIDKNEHIKTLGVAWNSITDTFQFSVQLEDSSKLTKRTILSSISKLFDPLGLVSPVIISAKLIMQRLWQSQVSWDEQVCPEIFSTWRKFRNSLEELNQISVDRLVIDHTNLSLIELHGFADASEKTFGACVYLRSISTENKYTTRLVISKSRLAPLKKITLPRLELCAAVLLSTLVKQVMIDLNINIKNIYLWTDSMITLAWIKSHSRTWKTFVANRVSKIHSHTNEEFWNHISGHENPADLISRGCHPLYLKNSSQWWHGPDWLNLDLSCWPISKERIEINDIPDRKNETLSLIAQDTYPKDYPIFNRFSTLGKLLRVTAYVLRFINNAKKNKSRGLLTLKEIDNALAKLIQLAQGSYSREIEFLKRHECVPKNSSLLSLNPFLDNNYILRVGGRLRHSQVTYNKKFPILLPKNHPLTELVIREEHVKQLHAGITGTLSAVQASKLQSAIRRFTSK